MRKALDNIAKVIIAIDADTGAFYGRLELGAWSFITGPWPTLDALLHDVGVVLVDRRRAAAVEAGRGGVGCKVTS